MAKKKEEKPLIKVKPPTKTHVDEKGSPFYVENRVDVDELGDKSWIKLVYKAIDYFKEGRPREVIVQQLKEETGGKIAEDSIRSVIVSKASQIIAEEYEKNDEYVLGLHLSRYNQQIKELYTKITKLPENKVMKPWEIQEAINGCYYNIMDIMHHKERLLQLHNKKVVVRINQINNTLIREKKQKWDLSNLTLEERIDFLYLISKSKKSSYEISGVIKNIDRDQDGNEIEDAIIISETSLDKITQTTKRKEIEIIPNIALYDTFEKLREAFAKKARLEFEKAGTKIVNDVTGEGAL